MNEIKKDPLDDIRRAALRSLTRRDHSERELLQKLLNKHYPQTDIDIILSEFVQTGLLNDARFAENYIRWRREKGYGPLRISAELQARGVTADIIAEALDMADNAWFTAARKVWQKHFKGKAPREYIERAKQMRFLQYRGFTREQIASVIPA